VVHNIALLERRRCGGLYLGAAHEATGRHPAYRQRSGMAARGARSAARKAAPGVGMIGGNRGCRLNNDGRPSTEEIDLRALAIIAAVVLGLVAGAFLIILNWFVAANLYFALGLDKIWGKGNASALVFIICVYVIWLFVLFVIKRAVAPVNNALLFVFVFLAVVPLPSIYGMYSMWEAYGGRRGGSY
jgi:hypothetical protein